MWLQTSPRFSCSSPAVLYTSWCCPHRSRPTLLHVAHPYPRSHSQFGGCLSPVNCKWIITFRELCLNIFSLLMDCLACITPFALSVPWNVRRRVPSVSWPQFWSHALCCSLCSAPRSSWLACLCCRVLSSMVDGESASMPRRRYGVFASLPMLCRSQMFVLRERWALPPRFYDLIILISMYF